MDDLVFDEPPHRPRKPPSRRKRIPEIWVALQHDGD